MRDHGGVAGPLGHFNGRKGFGQGADLIDLDEDRVGDVLVDALLEDLGVGHKQIVTHQLDLLAQTFGQQLPARPVIFGHTVFNRNDREAVSQGRQIVGEAGGIQGQAFTGEHILAVLVELG